MIKKYTSDGKKVQVIDELNPNEFIVRELSINKFNVEFPTGDKFIAKNLQDTPALTWRDSEAARLEKSIAELKDDVESLKVTLNRERNILKDKIANIKMMATNINPEIFDNISKYMSGEFNYFVMFSGSTTEGFPLILKKEEYSEFNNDGELRLISMMGKSNGDLEYAQGVYRDYSGSYSKFIPVDTLDDAKQYLIDYIKEQERYSMSIVTEAKKFNIKIDQTLKENAIKAACKSSNNTIEHNKAAIKKAKSHIASFNKYI